MDANVTYDGPGGSAELLGLYFADAGQHIEHRIFADHTAPRTKSHAVYKGALQGEKAHTVWVGNVLIRKVAEGIETYEENRNLVLTDGCRADSIPNLEIETGEIEGAGHASATARFDDEQLFYLQSRGVSEQEAQRLVVHGFFNDLIRQVGVPSIEDRLLTTVEAELAKNVLKDRSLAVDGRLMAFERACALDEVQTTRPSRSPSAATRSPSPATATRSSRSRTSAATPRSPSARARSPTARSSAGCTGRCSTCAPASPPTSRRPSRSPPSPSRYAARTCTSTPRPP